MSNITVALMTKNPCYTKYERGKAIAPQGGDGTLDGNAGSDSENTSG